MIAEKMIETMKIKWLKIATGQCMIAGKLSSENRLSIKVGEWTPQEGLVITDEYAFTEGRPPNITLRVRSKFILLIVTIHIFK